MSEPQQHRQPSSDPKVGGEAEPREPQEPAGNDADERLARQLQDMEHGRRGRDGLLTDVSLDGDSDVELARKLQQEELREANAAARGGSPCSVSDGVQLRYEDPVWGPLHDHDRQPRPLQLLCFSLFPCMTGSVCSSQRRAVWRDACTRFSFLFLIAHTVTLVLSLLPRGIADLAFNPMVGPYPDTLDDLGAKNTARILYNNEWFRLLSPIFLHAGVVHFLMNGYLQFRLGLFLELQWGRITWLLIYLISGLVSSLASAVALPDQLSVGASGALMGLMGAWSADLYCSWGHGSRAEQAQRSAQFVVCCINMAVVISFSAVPYVDWAAHLAGMVAGVLLGAMVFVRAPVARRAPRGSAAEQQRGGDPEAGQASPRGEAFVDDELDAPPMFPRVCSALLLLTGVAALTYMLLEHVEPPRTLLHVCQDMARQWSNYPSC